jgi:hypothetical protein
VEERAEAGLYSLHVEVLLSDVDERRVAPVMSTRCDLEAFAGEAVRDCVREAATIAR